MNVSTDLLRYFVAVAKAGSFIGGARRAYVSPPAISKAIHSLEQQLSVRLFERTTRSVALTQAGERVLAQSLRILDELDRLADITAGASAQPGGPIRIGAMEVFSIELLPSALAELVSAYRDVIPLSYEMIPQQMIERLLSSELDVGFTIGAPQTKGIDRIPLGASRGVLVCGRNHALYKKGRIVSNALIKYPFVVPRFLGAEHLPSLDQFPEDRHPRHVGATIELLQMGVELVLQGAYLGYFPEISVRRHITSRRLRILSGLSLGPPFELHALVRAERPLRSAAKDLVERIASKVKAPQ